jgi:hypothetical protein
MYKKTASMAVFLEYVLFYLATNGMSPINLARFIAVASFLWLFELTPENFLETIRACGFKNFFKTSMSL